MHRQPCNVVTGARKGVIQDGMLDPDTKSRVLAIVAEGKEAATLRGGLRGVRHGALEVPSEPHWVNGTADQTNSASFVSDRYVLKLFRRIEPGPNPEFELTHFLTERGFTRVPALAGDLRYERPGLESATLAIVQGLVKHQGSGWDFTVDELRRYYERVAPRVRRTQGAESSNRLDDEGGGRSDDGPFFAALENWYLASATTLGRRTAELHLALASGRTAEFEPEPLGWAALRQLADRMRAHVDDVLTLLRERIDGLNEATRRQAEAVMAAAPLLLARIDLVGRLRRAGVQIRVHGDYHLGQVLRTEDDFVILDFEGEPARSLEERRAKQSPLKDVAGMLRSFSYAAYAALFAFTLHARDDYAALEPWADTWQRSASQSFLKGYRSTIGASGLVPGREGLDMLLGALTIEKALYEVAYELNSRPDWVRIPLTGLMKLALPMPK